MELLILFGFLSGWFVCWIQMSKSRYLTRGQSDYLMELWLADSEQWKSEYQQLQSEYQTLQSLYQKSQSKSPAPLEFESQQWKSPYPESAPVPAPQAKHPDSSEGSGQLRS